MISNLIDYFRKFNYVAFYILDIFFWYGLYTVHYYT